MKKIDGRRRLSKKGKQRVYEKKNYNLIHKKIPSPQKYYLESVKKNTDIDDLKKTFEDDSLKKTLVNELLLNTEDF